MQGIGVQLASGMSSFGTDLFPGEPCSRSLDHNFYASDTDAQPSVLFNTLESDCTEEPLLDPNLFATGWSTWEESPHSPCSELFADKVQSPPSHAIKSSAAQHEFGTSFQRSRGQNFHALGHNEPDSSPPSLLDLYLTRKSRRVLAVPQATTSLTEDVCLLPMPSEQPLIPPLSSGVVASTSTANKVLCDVHCVTGVGTTASRSLKSIFRNVVHGQFSTISGELPVLQCQPDNEDAAGNLGDGLEFKVDGIGCSQGGSSPCATRMQQVATSDGSLNLDQSNFQARVPNNTSQKGSVLKLKSGSLQKAKVYAGAEVAQPRQHVQRREDGWRCPRASKRLRTSRQSLLDDWIN